MSRTILLNPGPVNVSAGVRAALAGPDLCHREPEFFDLQDAIRTRLLTALGAPASEYASILLTGSGTAAVEAMIASGVPRGGRLLVVQNGVYGARMASMARAHGIELTVLDSSWFERPAIGTVGAALANDRFDALAVVHHETTTGLLNDLGPIARLCRSRHVRLLVDAVSALGGERFDFDAWMPDAVACTANKCIQGVPGLSFVLARREFIVDMSRQPERSVYLHLPRYHDDQERRSTPFTPAVQAAYALLAALDELARETLPARLARFARGSAMVRAGLEDLGFELLLPPALRSNTLTAAKLPKHITYGELHDRLKEHGFVIYAGQGPLAGSLFRVAVMGDVPESEYRRFLDALGSARASHLTAPGRP
jgi:2-aminoethylphosphonate-pyruvate transaminase